MKTFTLVSTLSTFLFLAKSLAAVDERPPVPIPTTPGQPASETILHPQTEAPRPQVYRPVRLFTTVDHDLARGQPRFWGEFSRVEDAKAPFYRVLYSDATHIIQYFRMAIDATILDFTRIYYKSATDDRIERVVVFDRLSQPIRLAHYVYQNLPGGTDTAHTSQVLKRVDLFDVRANQEEAFIMQLDVYGDITFAASRDQAQTAEAAEPFVASGSDYMISAAEYGDIATSTSKLDSPNEDRYDSALAATAPTTDTSANRIYSYSPVGPLVEQSRFYYDSAGNLIRYRTIRNGVNLSRRDFFYNERSQVVRENLYASDTLTCYFLNYYNTAGQVYNRERFDPDGHRQQLRPND